LEDSIFLSTFGRENNNAGELKCPSWVVSMIGPERSLLAAEPSP